MSYAITAIRAHEILDSRGTPTLEVRVEVGPHVGISGVPSGASKGRMEAAELRDGDVERYRGAGVQCAARSVNGAIAMALVGKSWESLDKLDAALCELDDEPDKATLGANAMIGVSMAAARAFSASDGLALYRWLPRLRPLCLPVPHFNVVNGGVHARNRLDFQEFMVAPLGAPTFAEALRSGAEIYAHLGDAIRRMGLATNVGDEGGYAPALQAPEDVLDLICEAIGAAGYQAGTDGVAIALDAAASQFREEDGHYHLNGSRFDSTEMVDYLAYLLDRYPIYSIEDGVAEDDGVGWWLLTERLGSRVQLVGDDNLVTSPALISAAAEAHQGNAALIKPNQVGTVSETIEAVQCAYGAGWAAFVSHRSGETTDAFIADFSVATGCGLIKAGAPARGERVAKYNRLLSIEADEPGMPYGHT